MEQPSGPASDEGYGGAFGKGVLSTLLATPCSGPFLGSALAWAIVHPRTSPTPFSHRRAGHGQPILLVGLFPRLVGLLPRPGNWMVTFKQMMGFVLLAYRRLPAKLHLCSERCPTVLVLLASASDAGGFAEDRCWNRVGDDCEHGVVRCGKPRGHLLGCPSAGWKR